MQVRNSEKRLVFISYHYLPNPNFRSSATWEILKAHFPKASFLYGNWNHLEKKRIEEQTDPRSSAIHVPEYYQNLSLARIASHVVFAIKLLFRKELYSADIIFCSVPPNISLVPATLIKIFKPNVKVVCDIVDLWPEAIPLGFKTKKVFDVFALPLWKLPRNLIYKTTDLFTSHCIYFLNEISPAFLPPLSKHLPLCLMDFKEEVPPQNRLDDKMRFLLLGSINNIFDVDKCVRFFNKFSSATNKKLILEIIGLGEKLEALLQRLRHEAPKLEIINHGAVFDRNQKDMIMSQIHFGLNLYKNTTAIGVSYKSIEYMAHGIPLLNSAQGDLYDLILKKNIGLNIGEEVSAIVEQLANINNQDYEEMRNASYKSYQESFSKTAFEKNLLDFIEEAT